MTRASHLSSRPRRAGNARASRLRAARRAIEQIAFVSTPSRLAETLASYAETGIDELGLMLQLGALHMLS